jgi:hypothetical protein
VQHGGPSDSDRLHANEAGEAARADEERDERVRFEAYAKPADANDRQRRICELDRSEQREGPNRSRARPRERSRQNPEQLIGCHARDSRVQETVMQRLRLVTHERAVGRFTKKPAAHKSLDERSAFIDIEVPQPLKLPRGQSQTWTLTELATNDFEQ